MTRPAARQFGVLWRAFCAQLVGEGSESEAAQRQRLVVMIASLAAPALFILLFLFPMFSQTVLLVRYHRAPASLIDDRLEWIAFLLETYATVGAGFIAVLCWDALTFTGRDAMVLGPLPIRPSTLFLAKLSALGTLLAAASCPIAILQSMLFALETTIEHSVSAFLVRFGATAISLMGASLFSFSAIVALRALMVLLFGGRRASALGPPLQFLFVLGMMCLIFMTPPPRTTSTPGIIDMLPSAWFVGLFERLRGSPRADWPQFAMHARRALLATPASIAAAIGLSAVTLRQQLRASLAPSTATSRRSSAAALRAVARRLAGRSSLARATADFVLLTLSRSRTHQQPLAVGAAVGAAIALTELTRRVHSLADVRVPRALTFGVPLVLGYCPLLGVRRALKLPNDLPAAWTFRLNAQWDERAIVRGVRAAVYAAIVLPLASATALTFGLLVGWPAALAHTAFVAGMMTFICELVLRGVENVPFTTPERPPETAAAVWWVLYGLGLMFFAYIPARLEPRLLQQDVRLVLAAAAVLALSALLARLTPRLSPPMPQMFLGADAKDAMTEVTILDLT